MMGTQRHRDLRTNAGSAVLVPECSGTAGRNYCGIARLELPDRLRGRIERAEALEIRVGVAACDHSFNGLLANCAAAKRCMAALVHEWSESKATGNVKDAQTRRLMVQISHHALPQSGL
jgi:hypothetical protein